MKSSEESRDWRMSDMSYTQPIFDTDIWVFLIHSGFDQRLMQRYGFLIVSDVVEKDILKWNRNSGDSKAIAVKYDKYKQEDKIHVIEYDSFDALEQAVINHQLEDYGLQHA